LSLIIISVTCMLLTNRRQNLVPDETGTIASQFKLHDRKPTRKPS